MVAVQERWGGSVVLGPGWLAFRGRFGTTHVHAHAAVQLVVVTSGTMELTDRHGGRRSARSAVIPARAPHAMHAPEARGFSVYGDPDSPLGRAVRSRSAGAPGDRVADWVTEDGPAAVLGIRIAEGRIEQSLRELARTQEETVPHPALRCATAWVRAHVDGPARLEDAAADLGISPSRLGHLFARDLGVAFPVYLRWARLRRAVELVGSGSTLTRAAHGAGFYDSSHLTRVVHEMFGLAPSALVPGVSWPSRPAAGSSA